jgi:transcriptional regulator GlxA family with amidase domain
VSERRVVIVTYPNVQSLDVFGPADVFDAATKLGGVPAYRVELASVRGGRVTLSNGTVVHTSKLGAISGSIDTLVVAGGRGGDLFDRRLSAAVAEVAQRCRRVASVCTGAFVLAEAGLLDGRRATTHWASSQRLQDRYPTVEVEADHIWTRDGNVWTSAGVTTGIDLALAMVADDHGTQLAREISRWLVVYVQRLGTQSQFSDRLMRQEPGRADLAELLTWIESNLSADLSVAALAEKAAMSERQLLRRFKEDIGIAPASFVLDARLCAAKSLLESTTFDVATIARRTGFANVETLHRGFRRRFGTTPGRHRDLFSAREAS